MVGRNDVDVRLGRLSASDVAFVESHHGRDQVGAQHSGNGARLAQMGGQSASQVAGLILVEDKAGQVGDVVGSVIVKGPTLELVNTNELDVGIGFCRFDSGIAQSETHGDDHIVTGLDELRHVIGIVLGVGGFDVFVTISFS